MHIHQDRKPYLFLFSRDMLYFSKQFTNKGGPASRKNLGNLKKSFVVTRFLSVLNLLSEGC
jgi:hypothetical protein